MRGRKNRRTLDWRCKKRALLRALLFAAAPMVTASLMAVTASAQTPTVNSQLVLPPLPLSVQSAVKAPNANPFCQPSPMQSPVSPLAAGGFAARPTLGMPRAVTNQFVDLSLSRIQLASGSDGVDSVSMLNEMPSVETTVRLLPLDAAASPAQSGSVRPNPMVVVEPGQVPSSGAILLPVVPMSDQASSAKSEATVTPPPAAAPTVVAATEITEPVQAITPPTVVAAVPVMPPTEVAETAAEAAAESRAAVEPAVIDAVEAKPVATHSAKSRAWKPQVDKEADASDASEKEGPVSFSLNDMKLVETSDAAEAVAAKPVATSGSTFADIVRQKNQPAAKPAEPVKGTVVLGKATSKANSLDSSAKIARGSAKTLLVPLDPVDDPKRMSPATAPDKRIVKGARPRVDVGTPSVAIERASHDSSRVAIGPVAVDASKQVPTDTVFQSDAPVLIDMKSAEVRALKFDGDIRKVQIGDSSICAALASGPTQIQLIGAREGVTRLAVWTASSTGQEQKTVYEVFVGTVSRNDASEGANVAATLTRSAKAAFPTSNIQVRHEEGKMVVEGVCTDNESAKQVLRMIRTACKLPVVDKLTIR